MFENYVGEKTKPMPQWAIAVIGIAVAIHVIAVGALVIKSFWTINKLGLPEGEVTLGAPPPPPPPPPAGSTKKKKTKKTITKTKEVAQVDEDKPKPKDLEPETETEVEGEEGGVEGGVKGGVIGGVIGGVEGGILGGTGSGPPPPPKDTEPKIIPQKAFQASRISGNDQIQPPNDVNVAIRRSGKQATSTFKICVTSGGSVNKVQTLRSSGYPKYDRKIKAEARRWKYKPLRVDGKAVPVCSPVTFIYRPKG